MRKPRDFDADLKALEARANQLKTRKQQQLGELVIATGADALPIEELAGALLAAVLPCGQHSQPARSTSGANQAGRGLPAPAAPISAQSRSASAATAAVNAARPARDTREWLVKAGNALFLSGAASSSTGLTG
jgi:hypothetical protein